MRRFKVRLDTLTRAGTMRGVSLISRVHSKNKDRLTVLEELKSLSARLKEERFRDPLYKQAVLEFVEVSIRHLEFKLKPEGGSREK